MVRRGIWMLIWYGKVTLGDGVTYEKCVV